MFVGELALVPYDFAPKGWALCNGQLLPINQNQALFSLLGTTFGGDGHVTFALPDLRGRVPVSAGRGPGLSSYQLGQKGGQEQTTLSVDQMPAHSHMLQVSGVKADEKTAAGHLLANGGSYSHKPADASAAVTAGMPPSGGCRKCVVTRSQVPPPESKWRASTCHQSHRSTAPAASAWRRALASPVGGEVRARHRPPVRASQTTSPPTPHPTSRAVPGTAPAISATSCRFGSPLQ
jgi:microcystin-dependent protein